MKQFFPILEWLPKYSKTYIKNDIIAGVTIGVLLIPQGMAYALLAGLPAEYGLYSALIPQLVYLFLGTSSKLAVGPVAMDSLLIASSLSLLTISSQEEYISYAILLSFLIGIIQIVLGLLRFGFIVNFLSKPVINGFTSAVAILIILNQSNLFFSWQTFQFNSTELSIGLFSILIAFLLKKYNKNIPSSLILVIVSIGIIYLFKLNAYDINLIGNIPKGLPSFLTPNITTTNVKILFPSAIMLAFIGYIEAMSINKALEEKQIQKEVKFNQELLALGFSNVIGSFFQSYVVTGSFSRTAVNVESGVKTNLGALISFSVIALALLFLTPIFYFLPKAVLATIIILSVIKLIDFSFPLQLWKNNKQEFLLLLFTFFATLFLGVKEGIGLSVLVSLLFMIYKISRPHIAVLGNVKGTEYYRNIKRFKDDIVERNDLLIIRFDAQLYFGNKDYFKKELFKLIRKKNNLELIVINAEAISTIDSSANAMLVQIFMTLTKQGLKVFISGAIGPTRDVLFSSGVSKILGEESFFVKTHEAVCFFDFKCSPSKIQKKISSQSTM